MWGWWYDLTEVLYEDDSVTLLRFNMKEIWSSFPPQRNTPHWAQGPHIIEDPWSHSVRLTALGRTQKYPPAAFFIIKWTGYRQSGRAGLSAVAKTTKRVPTGNQGRTSNPCPVIDVAMQVRLLVSWLLVNPTYSSTRHPETQIVQQQRKVLNFLKQIVVLVLQEKILAITIILTVTKKNWRANVYVYVSV
jgi:hypothetical protein